MRTPARLSISSARRGSVQFGRSATGPDKTSWATSRARSALTGAGPGATDFFSASMPPVMKALRQTRTVSSRTPKATIPRVAQSDQLLPLLFVRRNRGFTRHDPNLKSDQKTGSRPTFVGQPLQTCLAGTATLTVFPTTQAMAETPSNIK
jgi:hypothetical protein